MATDQKLISALYKLAQENFSVSDDTILDKLHFHIVNSTNFRENISTILPQLCDWLEVIIQGWNNKVLFYGVQVFTIRFIGNIGSDIIGFKTLQHQKVLNFLENLISSSDVQNDCCLMIALVNMFEMFLKHDEGWKWITESKIWIPVLNVSYKSGRIYTKRAVTKFISQILITSTNYATLVGNEIMNFICKPLISNHLLMFGACPECIVDTYDVYYVKPYVGLITKYFYNGAKIMFSAELLNAAKYLCDILEYILRNNTNCPVRLTLIHRENRGIVDSVIARDILDSCSSIQEHVTFSSLLFMVEVSNVLSQNIGICCNIDCCLTQVHSQIHCIIRSLTLFGHFRAIVHFCVTCLSWLSKIKQRKNRLENRCHYCDYFETTIVYCLRLYLSSHKLVEIELLNQEIEDCVMAQNLTKKICEECLTDEGHERKKGFQFIQLAVSALTRCYDLIDCHRNLLSILDSIKNTFHSLVDHFHEEEDLIEPIILQLLDLISKIVQNTHLTFPELIAFLLGCDITLMYSIIRLLGYETNDIRVCIVSLQTLSKFLRIHIMAEIFYSNPVYSNSSYSNLYVKMECTKMLLFCNETVLAEKLKCGNWEVRDTVIELFQTVLEIKELMPWFFDNTFPPSLLNLIFEKASDDDSAYVKASALNFFSKAVRCKFFADAILPKSLMDLAMKILLEDNMPVARKSACDLIAALYINHAPAVLNNTEEIFETMFLASTKDLDWEVKTSTLKFWQCTIDKHLMGEMLVLKNLYFPHLNTPAAKQEIVLKIIEVLKTLGESGCLKAIWLSLNDDCDLKVSQEAQCIVESLEKLNEKWDFVDEILKCYEDGEENESIKSYRSLTPKRFFSHIQNDNWREKIDSHKQWIENTCDNLPSLLDNILDDNRVDDWDHNAVDCY